METVSAPWRRRLGRELAGLVALKVAALALLWWLFFSAAPHAGVDAEGASRRLGMESPPAAHLQAYSARTAPSAATRKSAHD